MLMINAAYKGGLSQSILEQFKSLLNDKGLASISVTVEITDIEREVYAKIIL